MIPHVSVFAFCSSFSSVAPERAPAVLTHVTTCGQSNTPQILENLSHIERSKYPERSAFRSRFSRSRCVRHRRSTRLLLQQRWVTQSTPPQLFSLATPFPTQYSLMPAHQTCLIAVQSTIPPNPVPVPGVEVFSSNSNITVNNRNADFLPGGPPGDPDDDQNKNRRDYEIDLKYKG